MVYLKLVLASYFDKQYHGSGRKVGISPSKPADIDCDFRFDDLSPGQIYWDYHAEKKRAPKEAGEKFVKLYNEKCKGFISAVKTAAEEQRADVFSLLPFQDGDTLLSWETHGHMTYRSIAADALRELGYEVEEF